MTNIMKIFFKKLFCHHRDIEIKTESYSPESLFIVKSIIQCKSCEKTFAQHPNQKCCYVQHIHSQIMYNYWVNEYKRAEQK